MECCLEDAPCICLIASAIVAKSDLVAPAFQIVASLALQDANAVAADVCAVPRSGKDDLRVRIGASSLACDCDACVWIPLPI